MKVYAGRRLDPRKATASPTTIMVKILKDDGTILRAYGLSHIILHSPTGMSWGYEGSGPADTALSILADHLRPAHGPVTRHHLRWGGHPALVYHQTFKRRFVARWGNRFSITGDEIDKWLTEVGYHPDTV